MAENKNHHFVPQFYLRNFGNGDSIGLYNIRRKIHVTTASIRGQCQRSYLYGRDPSAEKALAVLEGAAAATISDIISTDNPPQPGTPAHFHLVTFIIFQWGRTPAAGAAMNALATKSARAILKSPGVVLKEMLHEIDSLQIQYHSPVMNSLKLVASMPPLLLDLALKVFVNKTSTEFITSDAPVVLFNKWCQNTRGMGTTGFASKGLQIFLPLSQRHLVMFYDSDIYSVGKKSSATLEVTSTYDVVGVNRLQCVTAEENLYYSGSETTSKIIDELPFQWRRTQEQAIKTHRAVEADGKSELIHLYHEPSDARLNAPCIKVSKRAKEVPVKDRPGKYREAAKEAAYSRQTDSKSGPPLSRPRTPRVINSE